MMTDAKPADPCSNCDGTGRTQGWPHTTCPTCKGVVTASEWDLDRAVCEIDRLRALHFQRTLDTAKIISERDRLRQRVAELEGALRVDAQRYRDEVDKIRANHSLAMEDAGRKMGGYLGETVRLEKELTHARAVVGAVAPVVMRYRDALQMEADGDLMGQGNAWQDVMHGLEDLGQTYDDYMAKQGGGG